MIRGEIKKASDIFGSNNRHKFMWCACPTCGIERWVLIVKGRPKSKWCNACAIRKPRTGAIVSCEVCGKEVYERPYMAGKKKYCSKQCYDQAQTKEKTSLVCRHCGKIYQVHTSYLRHRVSMYCSVKCAGDAKSIAQAGDKSNFWKGGISTENRKLRASKKWKLWREAVFERDNWTCQKCGARSGTGKPLLLHPHHIKAFAKYPELRFIISNGITLCVSCHKEVHHVETYS